MPKKAKTIRIKDRKNTNEIKSINTNKDLTLPASSPAGSDTPPPFYPPPLEPELPDAEAAYDFDSQGADETLR